MYDWHFKGIWDVSVLSNRRSLATRTEYLLKWPNNVVTYDSTELDKLSRKIVRNAIRELEANTCIRFKRRTKETGGYIKLIHGTGCSSGLGYPGNSEVRTIVLQETSERGGGCGYAAILHELLHSLGFHHTQTRTDRDKYVTVHTENVKDSSKGNFEKLKIDLVVGSNPEGKQYDYASILHYPEYAFSKNGGKTIDARGNTVGRAARLSKRDVITLNEHFGCSVPSSILADGSNGKTRGNSYGRGAGIVPKSCPDGKEFDAGLCYPKCRSGFYGVLSMCWQSCGGWGRDDGAYCAKPSSYGRGAGRSPCTGCSGCSGCGWGGCSGCSGCSSCSTKHCRHNEEINGLLCYPKCRTGYHNVGCCVCSPNCPSGMSDHGAMCWKKRYHRPAGKMPKCRFNEVLDAGLCYTPCRVYYKGVGPVCWWSPGDGEWAVRSNTYGEFL